jgi:pimeloyl-ACP methyl ester carboxylesterase
MISLTFVSHVPISSRTAATCVWTPAVQLVRQDARRAVGRHAAFKRRTVQRPLMQALDVAAAPVLATVQRNFETFEWRGYRINYRAEGPEDGEPVLLIHGFGASAMHWRRQFPALTAAGNRVFAIDLLGFGASDKPDLGVGGFTLELWRDLCLDFVRAVGHASPARKWALVGNSIGSLVAMMTAIELGQDLVRGVCMVNCAGGMVSFRLSELNPVAAAVFWVFNTVLFNRFTGPSFFRKFKTRENVCKVVTQAYAGGADAVDDELVSILVQPSDDEGAAKVFLAVLNGPAGPSPEQLLPQLSWCPTLCLWGDDDPFTPLARGVHPGCKFPEMSPSVRLVTLGNVGHCPHDARPELVNAQLVPFLRNPTANVLRLASVPAVVD